MRNTAASQALVVHFNVRKISGHSSKQRLPYQILGRSYFLRKGDLFSLVSLQTMIVMRKVEREEDKNLVSLLCLGDDPVISLFSIHVDRLVNLGG